MVSKKSRQVVRQTKHRRLRNTLAGTAERPRLAVFRSNNHMYVQVIDDTCGNTLVSASTLDADVKADLAKTNNVEAASKLGTVIAKKAQEKGIKESLVLVDSLAFIVNIPNKTVVTAMDQTDAQTNVFTNIDGAIIM